MYTIELINDDLNQITFVEGQAKGKVPFSNCLIINNCIIDTGISSGYLRRIKKQYPIKMVVFSHWHEDHFRDSRVLDEVIRSSHTLSKKFIENPQKIFPQYRIKNTPVEALFERLFKDVIRVYDTRIDIVFEDKGNIDTGNGNSLKVIYIPGHCEGHCCFYESSNKIAYLGDIDLRNKYGPWYAGTDSDINEFEESINKVKELEIDIAITEHTGIIYGSKNIRDELEKYRSIIYKRDDIILEELSETQPKLVPDLSNKNLIYKKYNAMADFVKIMESTMIEKHLNRLLKRNLIKNNNFGYLLN